MTRQFTAIIEREDEGFVALCPELDIASQGDTIEAARANLQEALELFLEMASPKRSSSASASGVSTPRATCRDSESQAWGRGLTAFKLQSAYPETPAAPSRATRW